MDSRNPDYASTGVWLGKAVSVYWSLRDTPRPGAEVAIICLAGVAETDCKCFAGVNQMWGVEWSMQITLGNVLVAMSVASGIIVSAHKIMRFLEKRFDWIDEMYFMYCKEHQKRVPKYLQDKFVKVNGDTEEEI